MVYAGGARELISKCGLALVFLLLLRAECFPVRNFHIPSQKLWRKLTMAESESANMNLDEPELRIPTMGEDDAEKAADYVSPPCAHEMFASGCSVYTTAHEEDLDR
eukprot:scaffold8319_cov277-Pinguiococcus_pyrenoidosus.AAC.2